MRKERHKWLYHTISSCHCSINILFIFLKYPFHKNPRWAENGDGCADSNIKCLSLSISVFLFCANAHQSTNIIHSCESEIFCKTLSVKSAHQIFAWLAGFFASTVRILLSRSTHCLAQCMRLHESAVYHGYSFFNSLYIFLRLGGILTHSWTEKLSPWACHSPWYGSCPSMTTLTLSTEVVSKAWKIFSSSGYIIFPADFSVFRKLWIFLK